MVRCRAQCLCRQFGGRLRWWGQDRRLLARDSCQRCRAGCEFGSPPQPDDRGGVLLGIGGYAGDDDHAECRSARRCTRDYCDADGGDQETSSQGEGWSRCRCTWGPPRPPVTYTGVRGIRLSPMARHQGRTRHVGHQSEDSSRWPRVPQLPDGLDTGNCTRPTEREMTAGQWCVKAVVSVQVSGL